ncbi:Peptide methionine sulfoxide reductase [Capsicum annuum]|nr:Peptide methionine sulfoxide reductase [Capsicum annuum]
MNSPKMSNWLNKLGFGHARTDQSSIDSSSSAIPQGPDDDLPSPGQQFAQFGAGCFWGVELAYQRVPGVTKNEVGYSQGYVHNPRYEHVCSGTSYHSEIVRVHYDPNECSYESLLYVFWARHDPTTLNRQSIYICFVLSWYTGLAAIYSAALLSQMRSTGFPICITMSLQVIGLLATHKNSSPG